MRVYRLLVERVDICCLSESAGGIDILGDNLDRSQFVPGKKHPGPLACKGACDGAADPTSGSVDHGHLVLQHHFYSSKYSGMGFGSISRRGGTTTAATGDCGSFGLHQVWWTLALRSGRHVAKQGYGHDRRA